MNIQLSSEINVNKKNLKGKIDKGKLSVDSEDNGFRGDFYVYISFTSQDITHFVMHIYKFVNRQVDTFRHTWTCKHSFLIPI